MTETLAMKKNMKRKERFSGVELFRIFAIFLICISHAVQTGLDFVEDSSKVTKIILNDLSYLGQMGNIMFIICSSYFLVDSKKMKVEKVFKLLLDSVLISVFVLLSLLIAGYSFSANTIYRQFFPDYFSNLWFIPIYSLFYLIHPLLNRITNNMNKKQHFSLCFVIFMVYGLNGMIGGWHLGVNELISFVFIYFFVSYMKKYCSNFSDCQKKNVVGFLIFFTLFVILATLKQVVPFLKKMNLIQQYSPVLLPMLLCFFNIFKNMKFKCKIINFLASCVFFVYCIHENILLRTYVRPAFYEKFLSISTKPLIFWVFVCGIGMFVLGGILAIIYRLVFSKFTFYLSIIFSLLTLKTIDFAFAITNPKKKDVLDSSSDEAFEQEIEKQIEPPDRQGGGE